MRRPRATSDLTAVEDEAEQTQLDELVGEVAVDVPHIAIRFRPEVGGERGCNGVETELERFPTQIGDDRVRPTVP